MGNFSENVKMVLVLIAFFAIAALVFFRVAHVPDALHEMRLYFPELF